MRARVATVLLALALLPAAAGAAPTAREPHFDPRRTSAAPSYVQRVEPALVGLSVKAAPERPSSARLGAQRFGTGIVFDARGYAVTVSYLVLDALTIEARLRDGRTVPATLTGLDLDAGLAVVRLEGPAPWPAAELVGSQDLEVGAVTGTAGLDEDGDLVHVTTRLSAVRRFSAFWEYMLDRALMLTPSMPSWGGSAAVDERGRVVGIVSLRLGEPPHVSLAIPTEKLLAVKDELISAGRVVSRRPRPWLGLYTAAARGRVVVDGFNEAGPARTAGFRRGDQIVGVDGVGVATQEEFYEALWRRRAGETIEVSVRRADRVQVIPVRSIDRHRLFRPAP
ncbi:MAG TPA: S1C family serine protease [Candidatus Binatia bacterium]|nr:S1C family serine protease [Candidatus Binatia bacterium]